MKQIKKIIITIIMFIIIVDIPILSSVPIDTYAHSGRTDSAGGHHDYKNKSGLGSYHYHHGQPAHLHPNGICPYEGSGLAKTAKITSSPSIKVSNISATMTVGDISNFDAKVENSSNTNINVTSSDPNVIAVNNNTLTAKNAGIAIITIGNDNISKNFTITVKEVYATGLEISSESGDLQVGEILHIGTKLMPSNVTNKHITFESSNENVATVSCLGTVKGLAKGRVTITASTSNGISKSLDINVFEVLPDGIECEDEFNLVVGDRENLKINILPENSNNKKFTITSDNKDIIKYSDDQLIAIKEGKALLNIETWNGIKKSIPVKVDFIPVESVEIMDSTKYILSNIIDKSDIISLQTKILPTNATYQDVTWYSSNDDIVNVNNNEFYIMGTGKVTLTCVTHENIDKNIEIIIIDKNIIITIFVCCIIIIVIAFFLIKRKCIENK